MYYSGRISKIGVDSIVSWEKYGVSTVSTWVNIPLMAIHESVRVRVRVRIRVKVRVRLAQVSIRSLHQTSYIDRCSAVAMATALSLSVPGLTLSSVNWKPR